MTVHPLAQKKVQEEGAKKLHEMLKDLSPEFQQKVLDTIKGMTLMLDNYKKTG